MLYWRQESAEGRKDAAARPSHPFRLLEQGVRLCLIFGKEEAVSPALLRELRAYREANPLADALRPRIPRPRYHYYGREIWEQAIAALFCGKTCC